MNLGRGVYRQRTSMIAAGVLVIVLGLALLAASSMARPAGDLVVVAEVYGVIDSAMCNYVNDAITYAHESHAKLLVILLNTPGGSLDAALCITEAISKSPVPVAGFVVERWAVSAGTMILMCSHYAAMQPGTIIGAVQPVALTPTGTYQPINESKMLNPVYKKIEACMRLYNRNITVAKRFVYENLVLTAEEAVKIHVVEAVAVNIHDLLAKINGSKVNMVSGQTEIVLHDPVVEYYSMPLGQRILHYLSDPLVSSIFSSIGILLLIVALASGTLQLAVVAIALLLLSFIGFGLAASLAAAALILFGLILIGVELFVTPGFGIIGFTGIALTLLGVLIGFTGKPTYIAGESLRVAQRILIAVIVPLSGLMGIVVYKAARAWRRKPVYMPLPVGKQGRAIDEMPPGGTGFVMVEGEYWQARNVGRRIIRRDEKVRVVGKDGVTLLVVPYEEGGTTGKAST
ncbi:NfeD family protein [Hyperthermus butylicus]|uniref:Membrane-bound serine protease (ClpP class) n=1 Tax=Hyperthermus butylicus (strain DSM 5456 / JCM 9403 / PLM1-5) TaxID=415426 RepID=A2BJ32_HYPBU|nr:nodulation protein NfeD [Hyperthermus butylicus]ABM79993.1 Membrane-bound serine protease (ClpP class) [Hyperthermus butylicus DSM 5456]